MMKKYLNTDVQIVKFRKNNLKDQAHLFFDKIWIFKYLPRKEAYEYLAGWLGVPEPEAHMSKMDDAQCKKVIECSIQILNDMRRLDLDWGDEINHPYYELITK